MKKRIRQVISIFTIVILFCVNLSLEVFAEPLQSIEKETEGEQSAIVNSEKEENITERLEEAQDAECENADDESILQSMEQVPDISEDASVEDQIIVVYENPQESGVENLELDVSDVAEGESLCETVDLLVPDDSVDTDELVEEIEGKPGVAAACRNEMVELYELPNDPYIADGRAWQFQMIGAEDTWNKARGSHTVKVAVIDSGLNVNHPDLAGRCEIGYDYVERTSRSMKDLVGHGTEVSGLIAATANNNIGISGIAGEAPVKVVAYRVGGAYAGDKLLNGAYIIAAMEEIAARPDIQIVNMSFGSEVLDSVKEEAIRKLKASGKLLVASSGNDGDTRYNYPASCEGVISVSALNAECRASDFSNRNSQVDLCAPGDGVCTTDAGGDYSYVSGTSYASPIVAGAAAVLKCVNGGMTAEQIEEALKSTAKDLGPVGRDDVYGYGMIQLQNAAAEAASAPQISYQTHVQKIGWQDFKYDGDISGTSGSGLRLEGIKINISGSDDLGVSYRTHVQGYGWQSYVSDGAMSGTSGEGKRLEAIQMKLTGRDADRYDIYYRVHTQSYGWLGWAKNNMAAGTEGLSKRLEAIQIVLVKKGESAPGDTDEPFISLYTAAKVRYRTHVQKIGWQEYAGDGAISGTSGKSYRLEGINVSLSPEISGGIQYRTHVQKDGWEKNWKSDGAMSGTSGRALRLEAIRIRLTGEAEEKYDVYYRVHCQRFGWLGWTKNGQEAGSAGYAYRLEAIQIQLVEKGAPAPGSTANAYYEK